MKYPKFVAFFIAIVCMFLPMTAYAEEGSRFITYDIASGTTDSIFSKASLTITLTPDEVTNQNYNYYGIDVGVFKLPEGFDPANIENYECSTVFVQRLKTNALTIEVEDFGSSSGYDLNSIYVVGYRVLYKPNGGEQNSIIEMQWKLVENSFFKATKIESFAVYDMVNNKSTGIKFSKGNLTITLAPDEATNENYNYYGVDVGVFKLPEDFDPADLQNYECNTTFIQRINTNALTVNIEDFGPLSAYDSASIYVVGYRVLYKPDGGDCNSLIEMNWNMVKNSYFKKIDITSLKIEEPFTDRVTAANNWMTDEEAEIYNWYNINSEVVCRLTVSSSSTAEKIDFLFDMNNSNPSNSKIKIKDLRIVGVSIGDTHESFEDGSDEQPVSNSDRIKYSIIPTEDEKGKPITIYVKYTIARNGTGKLDTSHNKLLNTAEITETYADNSTNVLKESNEIKLADVEIKAM